jgi:phage gp45-like
MTAWPVQAQLDRLYRRVLMGVAPVLITATNDTGPIHKAQIRVNDTPETIDNVGVMQIYGLASHAMTGSDATAVFIHGHRDNPVIVATGNQQHRLRGLQPGEVALYDNNGTVVKLAAGGNIEITCTGAVKITAPSVTIAAKDGGNATVTLTGDLKVSGQITAAGDVHAGDSSGLAGTGASPTIGGVTLSWSQTGPPDSITGIAPGVLNVASQIATNVAAVGDNFSISGAVSLLESQFPGGTALLNQAFQVASIVSSGNFNALLSALPGQLAQIGGNPQIKAFVSLLDHLHHGVMLGSSLSQQPQTGT